MTIKSCIYSKHIYYTVIRFSVALYIHVHSVHKLLEVNFYTVDNDIGFKCIGLFNDVIYKSRNILDFFP